MSIDNFIPAIWSARLLANLNNEHVFADLCNRDYEGDIKQAGDTVKINSIGHVTIGNYTKNANLPDPEELQDSQTNLTIDISKSFNFQVDDIDKAQGKPDAMDAAMQDAGWGLADVIDQIMAGNHVSVPAANKIGADGANAKFGLVMTAGSSLYDYLVDLGVILDQNNTPKSNRWVVLPPWAHGQLQKDSRFVAATQQGNDILQNGIIGRAAGFDIRESNNVTNDGQTVPTYRILAGWKGAVSYAEQLVETVAYRPEKRFADAVKGLLLAGQKVTRPKNLACLYVKNAAS